MTKTEYMEILSKKLKKLPKDAYQEAIEYFEEYFAEAGNDAEAIENLGTPQEAADQIVRNMVIQNVEEVEGATYTLDGAENMQNVNTGKSVKKKFSAVWIGILAIFAAPIGLPLAFALAAVIFAVLVAVFACVFSAVVSAVAIAASAIIGVIGSICLLFTDPVGGIATLGLALISTGVGILIICACIVFGRWFYKQIMVLFGKIARREKKNEK